MYGRNFEIFFKLLQMFFIIYVASANPPHKKFKTEMIERFREQCSNHVTEQPYSSQHPASFAVLLEVCEYLRILENCDLEQVCRSLIKEFNHDQQTQGIDISMVSIRNRKYKGITINAELDLAIFFMSTDNIPPNGYDGNFRELYSTYGPILPKNIKTACIEGAVLFFNNQLASSERNEAVSMAFLRDPRVQIHMDQVRFDEINQKTYDPSAFMGAIPPLHRSTGEYQYGSSNVMILFSAAPKYTGKSKGGLREYEKNHMNFLDSALQTIRKNGALYSSRVVLWGSQINFINGYSDFLPINLLGITISGPTINAWSKPVKVGSESNNEIIRQLVDFNNKIYYEDPSKTVAMIILSTQATVFSPDNVYRMSNHLLDELRVIEIFRQVFPYINSMTLGIEMHQIKYCTDSTLEVTEDRQLKIEYGSEYACLLIINYNSNLH